VTDPLLLDAWLKKYKPFWGWSRQGRRLKTSQKKPKWLGDLCGTTKQQFNKELAEAGKDWRLK